MKRDIFFVFIALSFLLHMLLFLCSGHPDPSPPKRSAFRRTYRLSSIRSVQNETGEELSLTDSGREDPATSGEKGAESFEGRDENESGEDKGDQDLERPFLPAEFTGIEIAYPYLSRRRGEEGDVLAEVLVGRDGRIIEVKIIQSSGYERLDRAVVEGIEKSRARPAMSGGAPVQSRRVLGPFHFRLKE